MRYCAEPTLSRLGRRLTDNAYWRTCPTCRGSGVNPKMPMLVRPKCNGERKVRR
jgi:DnaJ-class molecular chaperone